MSDVSDLIRRHESEIGQPFASFTSEPWRSWFSDRTPEISQWSSFAALIGAISNSFEHFVRCGLKPAGITFSPVGIAYHLISNCFKAAGSSTPDVHTVQSTWSTFSSTATADCFDSTFAVPLHGLRCPTDSIELEPYISIEIKSKLPSLNWFTSHPGNDNGLEFEYSHCLAIRVRDPACEHRTVSNGNKPTTQDVQPIIERTMEAIALFQGGLVYAPTTYHLREEPHPFWSGPSSVSLLWGARTLPRYRLSGDQVPMFAEHVRKHLKFKPDSKNLRGLRTGIKRLCLAVAESDPGDRLVDLMIAAEALFLSDSGADKGELKTRLSERAACYLERSANASRLRIFELMRKCYDERSKIVHGSEPRQFVDIEGDKLNAIQLADEFENVIRRSINSMLKATQEPFVDTAYWRRLVLGV